MSSELDMNKVIEEPEAVKATAPAQNTKEKSFEEQLAELNGKLSALKGEHQTVKENFSKSMSSVINDETSYNLSHSRAKKQDSSSN